MTLRSGKLPPAQLDELLRTVVHRDPRVLVGPAVGRDAAVIDLGGGRLLVAKTDPVTFATEHIGWYAVHVNANDVACMGARPAWFMASALLPPGAPDTLPASIFAQLREACEELGVELVGGHTEVTVGLDRPIIAGTMLGEASPDEIILGQDIAPGDTLLLTKGVAIEGTALLAREAAAQLIAAGLDRATIGRARELLFRPGISVVRDAAALCAALRPRLLHDPTEGGVATALFEMAAATGMTLRIEGDAIPVLDETRAVCEALGLDPLGLLASGALLAIVPEPDGGTALAALSDAGVEARRIGAVESGGPKVIMGAGRRARPFPAFARDELARFFEAADGAQHE